jgi:hypothetical protein
MKKLALIGLASIVPFVASAQTSVRDIGDVGTFIVTLINNVAVPVIFALAFIVFIWGVFQYFILGGSDEEKRKNGQQLMLWGLIGFFIMVSVWGLVNILTNSVNLDNGTPTSGELPDAPRPGNI